LACFVDTQRLALEPLRVEHAEEAAALFDDVGLHEFIGGAPLTAVQLRSRYARLESGRASSDDEGWLNWTVRLRETRAMVGAVQATLRVSDDQPVAALAWTTATGYQRRGYATEAASAVMEWLGEHGMRHLVAHVNPAHAASVAVAARVGMTPTGIEADGEMLWTSDTHLSRRGLAAARVYDPGGVAAPPVATR
jgi:RimJ/RimL family protein N-acetyltransferase